MQESQHLLDSSLQDIVWRVYKGEKQNLVTILSPQSKNLHYTEFLQLSNQGINNRPSKMQKWPVIDVLKQK